MVATPHNWPTQPGLSDGNNEITVSMDRSERVTMVKRWKSVKKNANKSDKVILISNEISTAERNYTAFGFCTDFRVMKLEFSSREGERTISNIKARYQSRGTLEEQIVLTIASRPSDTNVWSTESPLQMHHRQQNIIQMHFILENYFHLLAETTRECELDIIAHENLETLSRPRYDPIKIKQSIKNNENVLLLNSVKNRLHQLQITANTCWFLSFCEKRVPNYYRCVVFGVDALRNVSELWLVRVCTAYLYVNATRCIVRYRNRHIQDNYLLCYCVMCGQTVTAIKCNAIIYP